MPYPPYPPLTSEFRHGVGVLAVQVIGGEAGLIFVVPMMLYLFVIAIGTDYNILMVARLREEARAGATPKVARAVEHAGPAVAAAAVILAGTFASLLTSGVGFLVQLGLTVAIGILLAAVMALFLVPGVTKLVGRAAWWPGLRRMPQQDATASAGVEHGLQGGPLGRVDG